jgi:hypothetical protein
MPEPRRIERKDSKAHSFAHELSYVPLEDEVTNTLLRMMYQNKIRAICLFYLSQHIELPQGTKHMKPMPPDKYKGANDVDDFIDWIIQICHHFLITGLGGRWNNNLRKICTTTFLGKRPRKWSKVNIKFHDRLICLFDRYIWTVSSDNAYAQYNAVAYDPDEGIQGLFDELLETAEKLVQAPPETELTHRFLE